MAHGLNTCYNSSSSVDLLRALNPEQNFLPGFDLDEEHRTLKQMVPREIPPSEPGQGGANHAGNQQPASENEVPDEQDLSEHLLPEISDISKMLVEPGSLPISTLEDYSDVSSCSEMDFQNHLSFYQNSVYPMDEDYETEHLEPSVMAQDNTSEKGAAEDQEENSVKDGFPSEGVAKETENVMSGGDQGAVEEHAPETVEENSDCKKCDTLEATGGQVGSSVQDQGALEAVAEAQDATKGGAQREAPGTEKDHSVPADNGTTEKDSTEAEEGQRVAEDHDTMETRVPDPKEDQSMSKADDPLETIETKVKESEEHHSVSEDQYTSEGVTKKNEDVATDGARDAMERRAPETENSVVLHTSDGVAKKTEDIETGKDHDAMERRAPETEENSGVEDQDTSEGVAKKTEDHMVGEGHEFIERKGPETEKEHHAAKPDETLAVEATEAQEQHGVGSCLETIMKEIASLTLESETLSNSSAEPSDRAEPVRNSDPQPSLSNTTQEVPKNNVHMVPVDHSVEDLTEELPEVERSSFDFLHSCFGLNSQNQISQEPQDPPDSTEDHDHAAKTKISSRTVVPASKLIRKLQPVVLVETTERPTHEGHWYHCALCPENFPDVDEAIEHQHGTHAPCFQGVQHCLGCRTYYSCASSAERHVCGQLTLSVNTLRQRNLTCRYCGKAFILPVPHRKHEQQHREVTPHRCPCCGLYFISEYKMKAHKRKARCMPIILEPQEHPSGNHQKMPGRHSVDWGDAAPGIFGCFVKLVDINQRARPAQCPVCGKGFSLQGELEAHMSVHSNPKPFKCNRCRKGFKYSWNLEDHKRERCSKERKDKPFRTECPVCALTFSHPYNVMRHLQKRCVETYFRSGKARTNDEKRKYKCPLCPYTFSMSFNCRRHLSNVCFQQYKTKWLEQEMSRFRAANPTSNLDGFRCNVCTAVYANASGLYRHMKKHRRALGPIPATNNIGPEDEEEPSPKIQPSFTCKFCDRCFSNVHSWTGHQRVHTGDNPFSCLQCGKNFPKRKYLLSHRNVHSSQIQCSVCKKILPSVGDLLKHRKSHGKKGLLQCPSCPMQFKFPVFFLRHIKIHTKKTKTKPLATPLTLEDAEPKQEPLLTPPRTDSQKLHRRTSHKDMLDHKLFRKVNDLHCGICQSEFLSHTALSKHCLSHLSPVHENKCTVCADRWFTSRIALIRHMRLHTGEKPFKCPDCGMRFRRKEALKPHQPKCQFKKEPFEEVRKVKPKMEIEAKKKKKVVQSFECPHCPRIFSHKGHLPLHVRAHAAGSLVQCFKCQTFHKKSKISRHRANCGTPGNSGVHQCKNPSFPLKIKDPTRKTKVPKSSRSSFKERCPHCPKRFQFRSLLLRHLRSHLHDKRKETAHPGESTTPASRTKVLRCNICTKTFSKASSLRHHIFIHTDAKPYHCETCPSSFSRADHLKVHQTRCRDRNQQLQVRVEKISLDLIGTGWQKVERRREELKCRSCSIKFSNHTQLSRHKAMMHSTLRRFPCKTCGKKFSSRSTLKRHNLFVKCKVFLRHNDTATSSSTGPTTGEHSKLLEQMKSRGLNRWRHQCRFCPRRFKQRCQLTSHLRLHTGEKPYACSGCGEQFIRNDYLQRHLSKCGGTSEPTAVLCELCGGTFTQAVLHKHQKTCGTDSPRRLRGDGGPVDDSSSTSSPDSKAQPKTQEPPAAVLSDSQQVAAKRPFQCKFCKMRFISKCGLVIHIRTHSTAYPLICKKCNQGFWNKLVYQKHGRKCKDSRAALQPEGQSEKVSDDKVIVFNKGSNTTGTGVLQTQFSCKDQNKTGTEDQPTVHKYQCSECDQSFTDGLRLISHLEAHGREDQPSQSVPQLHSCKHCDQTFRNAGLLQRHLKIQHKEKVINMCSICNRKFRYPSDLEQHKNLHDPNRPFVCGSCNLRYWTAKALNLHQKNKHYTKEPPKRSESPGPGADPGPPKLFACRLCDRKYSSRSTYRKHYRLKHKNTPESGHELQNQTEEQQTSRSESDGAGEGAQDELSDSDNDSDSAPYFPCHVCGKTFRTSGSLEDHQKCHLGEKPHECEECGKCFFQLSNLQQHQRSHKSEFQCQKCGKGFVSGFALRKHKNTHLRRRSHRCTKCRLCFTKSSELAEHLLTHREENFPCDVCHQTFSCKESREEHRKSHADMEEELPPLIPSVTSAPLVPQLKHRCNVCKTRFQDLEQLAEHVCNPTKERPYPCTDCDQHFVHGSHLKKHQLTHQLSGTRSFRCTTCHLKFSNRTHLLSHLQTHGHKEPPESLLDNQAKLPNATKPKIYQCPICPESFAQALELANHLSVHAHMCNVCSKTFPTAQQLEAHEQSHLSVATQYECTECGESFLGSEAFRQHRWAHQRHSQSPAPLKKRASGSSSQVVNVVEEEEEVDVGEDFFPCPSCNKRFSSSGTLQEHQRQHHDERPFKCPVCAKGFAKKKYLAKHQLIHSSRPYPCLLCPETFRTETALTTHQKNNHSKQHPCSLCSRTFHTSQELAQHKASHARPQSYLAQGDVQHACDLCYKTFKELHQLQKHQETHVAQVVYECTECDKAFADFNLLEEHQKTHMVSLGSLQVQAVTPIFVLEDLMFE